MQEKGDQGDEGTIFERLHKEMVFVQRPEEVRGRGMLLTRESLPGRGNNICKVPETGLGPQAFEEE